VPDPGWIAYPNPAEIQEMSEYDLTRLYLRIRPEQERLTALARDIEEEFTRRTWETVRERRSKPA
jgi:hypothetical protein